MNIFIPYPDIMESVEALDDKRVVKMTLETAQLVSTAIAQTVPLNEIHHVFYKSTHKNHPCAIWSRANRSNFMWLVDYGIKISNEYTYRYQKTHKSSAIFNRAIIGDYARFFPEGNLTPFANAAANSSLGLDFTNNPDTHEAYRLYLKIRWMNDKKTPKWSGRDTPDFI